MHWSLWFCFCTSLKIPGSFTQANMTPFTVIFCVYMHAVMTYLQINYECNINSGYKYTSKPISHTSSSLHLRHVPIEITNAINWWRRTWQWLSFQQFMPRNCCQMLSGVLRLLLEEKNYENNNSHMNLAITQCSGDTQANLASATAYCVETLNQYSLCNLGTYAFGVLIFF